MDKLVAMLRAAAEGARLRMLALCAEGELTVTEITDILGMTQPAVSRHLKILAEVGLLLRFREGNWVFYRLADVGEAGRMARVLISACNPDDPTRLRDSGRLSDVRARRAEQAEAYFRENAPRWDEIRALHVDEVMVEVRLKALCPSEFINDYLDIGVGTGRVLELLAPRSGRAAGLDNNHAMLGLARDRVAAAGLKNCSLRHGDLYAAPFADNRFDMITAHLVLHYLDTPGQAIREMARMLAPGGVVILADFAPHGLDRLRDEHAHRRLGFATPQIRRWLEEAGLILDAEESLPGDPLTVCLWRGRKPAVASSCP